jgi:hypothetical protein
MDNKQCEGCYYWRGLSSTWGGGDKACHYLIETGKMKRRDGNKCLSKRKGKYKRNDTPLKDGDG